MSNTQDRIKQRRQYLKKKGTAYTRMSLAMLFAVPFVLIAFNLLMVVYFLHWAIPPLVIAIIGALSLFFLWCSWVLVRSAYRTHRSAKQLPYVPPVTSATLPAEEVLVRGSEEPTQEQGKVLLRGTDGSAGAGEQELLRGSQGHDWE